MSVNQKNQHYHNYQKKEHCNDAYESIHFLVTYAFVYTGGVLRIASVDGNVRDSKRVESVQNCFLVSLFLHAIYVFGVAGASADNASAIHDGGGV